MKLILQLLSFSLIVGIVSCTTEEKSVEKKELIPDAGNGGITLPENFAAFVVSDSLGRGRHIAVRDNGDLYIHLRSENENGNSIIALRDTTGDGRADITMEFKGIPGTGIEIHKGFLYYASRTEIYRVPLVDGELLPSGPIDTLVHMVQGSGHMEKTFAFDTLSKMYVNIGSQSNACQEVQRTKGSPGKEPCTELYTRGGIWKFSDSELHQQQDSTLIYATGIRNAVAVAWNPEVQRLFAAQHGRDDLHRFWPDLYTEEQNIELPAEEFFDLEEGDDMGWPYCYYDQFQKKKLLNPEFGGDGTIIERCEGKKSPLVAFPGHWAPNDLIFYQGDLFPERYKNGAFIAWHGSWNRLGAPQAGYNVAFIPMKDGKPTGDYEIFANGFMGSEPIENPTDAVYRPCGLSEGPDGSLYVVDSQKGRVWRILYYPNGVPEVKAELKSEEKEKETEVTVSSIPADDPQMVEGAIVYQQICQACHNEGGKGTPGMNPPLTQTSWVLGDKKELIKVVLNGLSEPIEIKGEKFNNAMGALGGILNDEQIANVLTYVRNSWGNEASRITAEEVAAVRAENK